MYSVSRKFFKGTNILFAEVENSFKVMGQVKVSFTSANSTRGVKCPV